MSAIYMYITLIFMYICPLVQDMTALVADFGLARMFQPQEKNENNKSNGRGRGGRRRWVPIGLVKPLRDNFWLV